MMCCCAAPALRLASPARPREAPPPAAAAAANRPPEACMLVCCTARPRRPSCLRRVKRARHKGASLPSRQDCRGGLDGVSAPCVSSHCLALANMGRARRVGREGEAPAAPLHMVCTRSLLAPANAQPRKLLSWRLPVGARHRAPDTWHAELASNRRGRGSRPLATRLFWSGFTQRRLRAHPHAVPHRAASDNCRLSGLSCCLSPRSPGMQA
jgi:hypothetical protein